MSRGYTMAFATRAPAEPANARPHGGRTSSFWPIAGLSVKWVDVSGLKGEGSGAIIWHVNDVDGV